MKNPFRKGKHRKAGRASEATDKADKAQRLGRGVQPKDVILPRPRRGWKR